jgi:hypothetical protein
MTTPSTQGRGEFRFTPPETGLFAGRTFPRRKVQFSAIEALAVFEGDIVLGTVRDLAAVSGLEGIGIKGNEYRWPGGVVVFRIADSLPHPERMGQAIKQWQDHTPIRRAGPRHFLAGGR